MFRLTIVVLISIAVSIEGHGRFMKPVSRSSVWRLPEFANQNPPPNYTDNQLNCGGPHQDQVVGGRCGVCGDDIEQRSPRDNEVGGQWYRGIITGNYNAGQVIDLEVEMTVSHLGYMEFRLCDNINDAGNQGCYRHLLQREDGSGSWTVVTNTGWYSRRYRLPAGVRCNHCVIQWNYRAGNNWGQCNDGSWAAGCGPQETFRGCSDVRIN